MPKYENEPPVLAVSAALSRATEEAAEKDDAAKDDRTVKPKIMKRNGGFKAQRLVDWLRLCHSYVVAGLKRMRPAEGGAEKRRAIETEIETLDFDHLVTAEQEDDDDDQHGR